MLFLHITSICVDSLVVKIGTSWYVGSANIELRVTN